MRKLYVFFVLVLSPLVTLGDVTPSRITNTQNLLSGNNTAVRRTVARSRNVDTEDKTTNARGTAQRSTVARTGGVSRSVMGRTAGAQSGGVVARSGTTTVTTSGGQSSSGVGSVSVNNATKRIDADSVTAIKTNIESLDTLREKCKKQYAECMDGFCNKLDENMGRCSCNKGVSNYAKTEEALKAANEELQEVAQKIQYIGLTPKEIETLFTQTIAEDTMQNTSDSTKLKNDLSRIKNMLVDVKGGSASAVTSDSGISLDFSNLLSFNIDSNGFDISSLFGTGSQNTQSISNQRGEALYKSGAARCKAAVLNTCAAYGIDTAVIINSYDVEIDKDCMLYERKLNDENAAMLSTIRNAKTVLQKARLTVAQQKNQYDLRGCISALDSCMQDDFVCGVDYEDCVDPTGKYIVDGKVVEGSMPGLVGGMWGDDGNSASATAGLYMSWNYDGKNIYAPNASTSYAVADYINASMGLSSAQNSNASDISTWLQSKMGYHDKDNNRNYGMCVAVLNKCQKYTYDSDGYMGANIVISNWLERAFQKIKKAQDDILINYAQSCLNSVYQCLSQNNFNGYTSGTTSGDNPSDVAIRACLSVINSCRSVTIGETERVTVETEDLSDIYNWLDAGVQTSYAENCEKSGGAWSNSSCECSADNYMETTSDGRLCQCVVGFVKNNATDVATCVANTQSAQDCLAAAPRKEWVNGGCQCASDYPNVYNDECLTDAELCARTGGSWQDSACSCSAEKLLTISGKSCKCISGLTYDSSIGKCTSSNAQTMCTITGGEWASTSNYCSCQNPKFKKDGSNNWCTCYNNEFTASIVNNKLECTANNPTQQMCYDTDGNWYNGECICSYASEWNNSSGCQCNSPNVMALPGVSARQYDNKQHCYYPQVAVCNQHGQYDSDCGGCCSGSCEQGYEMVYDAVGNGLYCLQPQQDTTRFEAFNGNGSACVVKYFPGISLQPGQGACTAESEDDAQFYSGSNWMVLWNGDVDIAYFGSAFCVNRPYNVNLGSWQTGADDLGNTCACALLAYVKFEQSGINLEDTVYMVPIQDYSSNTECTQRCPAECAFKMMTDDYFRRQLTTARQ